MVTPQSEILKAINIHFQIILYYDLAHNKIMDELWGPGLQSVDINHKLFAIDINHNYVHKR